MLSTSSRLKFIPRCNIPDLLAFSLGGLTSAASSLQTWAMPRLLSLAFTVCAPILQVQRVRLMVSGGHRADLYLTR